MLMLLAEKYRDKKQKRWTDYLKVKYNSYNHYDAGNSIYTLFIFSFFLTFRHMPCSTHATQDRMKQSTKEWLQK